MGLFIATRTKCYSSVRKRSVLLGAAMSPVMYETLHHCILLTPCSGHALSRLLSVLYKVLCGWPRYEHCQKVYDIEERRSRSVEQDVTVYQRHASDQGCGRLWR